MYQVGLHQEVQVLWQALLQTKVQLLTQVKIVLTNSETVFLMSHQWNTMMIIYLNHHMYQVGFHTEHQLLCQAT